MKIVLILQYFINNKNDNYLIEMNIYLDNKQVTVI